MKKNPASWIDFRDGFQQSSVDDLYSAHIQRLGESSSAGKLNEKRMKGSVCQVCDLEPTPSNDGK